MNNRFKYIGLFLLVLCLILFFLRENVKNKPANTVVRGSLITSGLEDTQWQSSGYEIEVDDGVFSIIRTKTNQVVFSNPKYSAFVLAGTGDEKAEEYRGSFYVSDNVSSYYKLQTIDQVVATDSTCVLLGRLKKDDQFISYKVLFHFDDHNIDFNISIDDEMVNRTFLSLSSTEDELISGLGTQYSYFNLKGNVIPYFISEQGIGRGDEPLTSLLNLYAHSGGSEVTSYNIIPFYTTSSGYGLALDNTEYSSFDFRGDNYTQIEVFSNNVNGTIYSGRDLEQTASRFVKDKGGMMSPPSWTQKGLILGVQGGTDIVLSKYLSLKASGVPISGVWIQDWVGQRTTTFGKQLWWNWTLDTIHYANFNRLKALLRQDSVKLLGYVNPFLADVSERPDFKGRNLFNEARSKGYLVSDNSGSIVMIPNTSFEAAILDLTNEAARNWISRVIKEELIDRGFDGWMADFGEALPYQEIILNNSKSEVIHNAYPTLWAEVNKSAIESSGKVDSIYYFMRSGSIKSMPLTNGYWLGDQNVNWGTHDGIKSAVTGLITASLSGQVFNHSDIGGYTTLTQFPLNEVRSDELLLRWLEMNAFTPFFRSHEGNMPEANIQLYTNKTTLAATTKFAKIFKKLAPYRDSLYQMYYRYGMPVVKHPYLLAPEQPIYKSYTYQAFALGEDVYVSPVTDKGQASKNVLLPPGNWVHLWSTKGYEGNKEVIIDCPLGEPPVFVRAGSLPAKLLFKATVKEK